MNQALSQNPTAQLTINPAGMLAALKNAFSAHSNVVKELAQNARRAGADRFDIHFDIDQDEIEFLDNGIGIDDLRQLLSTAKSSWSEEISEKESPYGLGMLASFFACEEIEVRSRHQFLIAKTEDILNFSDVAILPLDSLPVTSIKLKGGIKKLMEIDFEEMFAGFPIPVFVNYSPLKRSEAIDQKSFFASEVGQVYLNKRECAPSYCQLQYATLIRFYFQGFFIGYAGRKDVKHPQSLNTDANIVHLDCLQFRAIAPDRHCLIDEMEAKERIEVVIDQLIKADIQSLVNSKEGIDLLLASYHTVEQYKQLDVYNRIDSLPINVLKSFSEYPVMDSNRQGVNREMVFHEATMSKTNILECSEFIFAPLDNQDDEHDFKAHMYCWKINGHVLARKLHPQHWVYSLLITPDAITVKTDLDSLPAPRVGQVDNGLGHLSVFCDSVDLDGPCGIQTIDRSFVSCNKAILVRDDVSSDVVLQSTGFQEEFSFDDSGWDYSLNAFQAFIKNERLAEQPELLIEETLNASKLSCPTLVGNTFHLTVSETGEFKVTKIEKTIN